MITLDTVSYTYPKSNIPVLRNFSHSFHRGETVAVTGPNGCGKTTLARLICGVLRPDSGTITIDGEDTSAMSLFHIGRRIGCVFQDPSRQLFCPTAAEEVAFGLKNLGLEEQDIQHRVQHWLERFDLTEHRSSYPGSLSQGQQQRLVLAAVLALGTDYVLLDEPASSLDMDARETLGNMLLALAQDGKGVIFVTHHREFVRRYAQRELVLHEA